MTAPLFRDDAYLRTAQTRVAALTDEGGIVPDQSVFYPRSGGQPGDSGSVRWEGGTLDIATCVKGEGAAIVLVPASPDALPPVGAVLHQTLDWDRRHRHMRVHTALHLLSVVIPRPVTGGSISAEKGRLDFDMAEPPEDRDGIIDALNRMVADDLTISDEWITEADLAAQPELVKTLSVQPPKGAGHIRLVRIGAGDATVDLQPCGGTHVARTGEIGPLRLGKIEKKGRQNRRVSIYLDG